MIKRILTEKISAKITQSTKSALTFFQNRHGSSTHKHPTSIKSRARASLRLNVRFLG